MLLSYFHALKNPTAVSIVQFVFWGLCSITNNSFSSHNEYLCFLPLPYFLLHFSMICLLHLCHMCFGLTLWRLAVKHPKDADENSPGIYRNPGGSEAPSQHWWPYTTCWSTSSKTCRCLGWGSWCSSQHFFLLVEAFHTSRIHSPIFPSASWLCINFIQYTVHTKLLPTSVS